MYFIDVETCGLHGVGVLLQYAKDDGPIELFSLWKEPVSDTMILLEEIAQHPVCGFNLAFDWFHLNKIMTMFNILMHRHGPDAIPEDFIDELGEIEDEARMSELVLKPKSAMDLMLHSRKGPYQSLMARKDIRIKKVPAALAKKLQNELENRIEIDGIYFARRNDKHAPMWAVQDIPDAPEFRDVVLKFSASGALKTLARHALKVEQDILKFSDIEVDRSYLPYEKGWAPFAKAFSTRKNAWRVRLKTKGNKYKTVYTWPRMVKHHIDHWAYNKLARKYAKDDVVFTRDLWAYFDKPEPGDDDSELACMVGCVRWRGFSIDIDAIKEQRKEALVKMTNCPISPSSARKYIAEVMDDIERVDFNSTKKVVLEAISKLKCDCEINVRDELIPGLSFDFQNHDGPCDRCDGKGRHPAAVRAEEALYARKAKKEVEVYDKLIAAGRFHASFRVIGTLSSRMSGADGLNAQGINHRFEIRDCFNLADPGFILCGGDFDSFEVVIADAAYDDPDLRRDITEPRPCQRCDQTGVENCTKCDGKSDCSCDNGKVVCDECGGTLVATYKIHGLFGCALSGLSYGDVIKSKGTSKDWYSLGKSGVFAMIYGGDWNTLVAKQGIDPEIAQKAEREFITRYPGIQRARERINDDFCSMRQPGGLGSKVVWNEPKDFIESLLGFRRYFTLENKICGELFKLANKPPAGWNKVTAMVRRRDKTQKAVGATSSAIYGASFQIQASNMRAAANHVIQSTGATITKRVQRKIWDLQPCGFRVWKVVCMNIHDEVACVTRPELADEVQDLVYETVESFRAIIPLIKMEWVKGVTSWATMK